jgi:hypothetical protein
MSKYLLDTSVFIQAKNDHYGMDFCPAFWDWLIDANRRGLVSSIEPIFDEMTPRPEGDEDEDELSKWVRTTGKCLFLPHDAEMARSMPTVSTWAYSQSGRYRAGAIDTFLDCADYHLVAYALAHGYTVVTHEKASSAVKVLKIPDACAGLGVPCVRPYDMLRAEGARFVMQLPLTGAMDAIRH